MSSTDRAINFPIRVTGLDQAAADFKKVGQSGSEAIGQIAGAAKQQAGYEAALVGAKDAAAAYAKAQATVNAELAQAKTALKAGTISQEQYNAKVLDTKSALSLVKAEHRDASKVLDTTTLSLVAARRGAEPFGAALVETGKSSGMMRIQMMETQHVVRSMVDSIAAGQSPLRAFSMEAGRVGEVLALSGGSAGKFGAFMGGPWGVAVTAATAILLPYIANLLSAGDAASEEAGKLKKNAEETEAARVAKELFGKTLPGVTAAILDQKEALDKQTDSLKTEAQRTLDAAHAHLVYVETYREVTAAILERALANEKEAQSQARTFVGGFAAGAAGGGLSAEPAGLLETRRVAALQAELDKANAALKIARANMAPAQAALDIERGKADASPSALIERKYEGAGGLIDLARRRAIAEGKVGDALERQVAALEKAKQAELDALKKEHGNPNRQFGREVDINQARSIAENAGFQVNSAGRSHARQQQLYDQWIAAGRPANNPVARPGTSAHEGPNPNALDIQFGKDVTPGSIRKAFEAEGVRLTKIFKESGHFHIEFSTAGADRADREQSAAARKAEAARLLAVRRQKGFDDAQAQLDSQLLTAKRAGLTDIDQIATFERQQVKVASDKYNADLKAKVALGDLTKTQADKLALEHAIVSVLGEEKIKREVAAQKLADAVSGQQTALDIAREQLSGQLALATTMKERRDLQLRLLADEQEQERLSLQQTIDQAALGKATAQQAADAQKRLDALGGVYANKRQSTIEQTSSPLERYIKSMDPGTVQERVNGLVTDELDSVRHGIDDAISSALGVQDPLLKGIIDLFIEQVLIRPIAEALQAHSGSGGGGGLGSILGAVLGSIGGHGLNTSIAANDAGALSSLGSTAGLSSALGGYASGTDNLPTGRDFWVGENGRERMRRERNGRISVLSHQQSHREVAGGGGGIVINQTINVPQRSDPRHTASALARNTQGALARGNRKGLAITGSGWS